MSDKNKHAADHLLLLLIMGITLFGFIMVASASSVVAQEFYEDPFFFVKHQVFYGGSVGLILFMVGSFLPY